MSRLFTVQLVGGRSGQELLGIAQRHKKAMLIVGCLVGGIGLLLAVLTPNVYRSESRLLVRLGRENVMLDPTATIGQTPHSIVPASREGELNSIVEILKGRGLLERLVECLTPDVVLADRTGITEGLLPRSSSGARDAAVAKLARMLEVAAVRKSNLISVTCDAHDPALAQQAVGKLVELFLEQHQGIYRNPGSHGFFAQQTELLAKELAETEAELLRLRNESGLGAIDDQRRLVMSQISSLEDDLVHSQTQMRATEAEISAMESKLASLPRTSVTHQIIGMPNPAVDNMRQQLYDLQLKERELSASLTDEHPLVKQIREQLAGARKILDQEQGDRVQTTQSRDKAHEQVEVAMVTQQTSLESLRATAAAIEPAIARARARLAALNGAEIQIARLERQRELQQANYLKHSQGLEQTRIDRALESERISNINIVQPPLVDSRPVKPNRLLTLAMSLVLATLGAVGVAAVLEYLERAADLTPQAADMYQPSRPEASLTA